MDDQQEGQLVEFWGKKSAQLPWFSPWNKVLDWKMPNARWFVGGTINASHACLDVHLKGNRGDKVAIYWEGESGNTKALTYSQLYQLVNKMACVLKNLGVKKGDIVVLYLPMIPEAVTAMLAVARLGAIHAVIFSGFGVQALQDRINGLRARFVITADVGWRRGKEIEIKKVLDEALRQVPSVQSVVVVKRSDLPVDMKDGRDFLLEGLLDQADDYSAPVPVESNHPLFVLYTSGTTGKPKGIVHSTGGYLTYTYWTMRWAFDPQEDSIYWCSADLGWITGHSYIVYAPLMHGLSVFMYEGAPDYPSPSRWWELIEKYKVSIFYTSPTALRMFMRHGDEWIRRHNIGSLKVLGSVGEPLNPKVWHWYDRTIGASRCPIIDTWWQTETGGFVVSPQAKDGRQSLKPGSTLLPLPGVSVDVVDHKGHSVSSGEKGLVVIKNPWPGMAIGVHNDTKRFENVYWLKFPGFYYAGDFAIRDKDGHFWFLGRADEILSVAGHRVGTAEIESAALMHGSVAEAAAVGVGDEIKGCSIIVFAVVKAGEPRTGSLVKEVLHAVRSHLGAFATPRDVVFVSSLPKTRSGKIMRRVLKAVYEGTSVGDVTTLEDGASVEEVRAAVRAISLGPIEHHAV